MATVQRKEVPQSKSSSDNSNQERTDLKLAKGKYELDDNDTFQIDLYLKRKDKRWIICDPKDTEAEHESVVFRMWNYDEAIQLKKQATMYDAIRRINFIDKNELDRLKIQKLLVSWSFDKNNPRLKLFHVNGILTDESWNLFKSLHPNICEFIIDNMNYIYENNG